MRKFLLSTAAIAAFAGASAMAQNTTTDSPAKGTAGADKMISTGKPSAPTPQTAAQDNSKVGPNFVQVQTTDMLSSNVVGLDVHNGQNANVGKIQDVAFDSSKQVTGYILSVGGFLGIGTHYVAVNPGAVMVSYDAESKVWRATMNATKDQLKAAPEFKYGGQWTASRS